MCRLVLRVYALVWVFGEEIAGIACLIIGRGGGGTQACTSIIPSPLCPAGVLVPAATASRRSKVPSNRFFQRAGHRFVRSLESPHQHPSHSSVGLGDRGGMGALGYRAAESAFPCACYGPQPVLRFQQRIGRNRSGFKGTDLH